MNARTISRLQAELADRYVIDRELGRGGMGIVFQARDKGLGRQVAIKLLDTDLASVDPKSFRREIKFTARLQHPHILPLLDTGEIDGQAYYVMPFVKGGSLRTTMNADRQLSIARAMTIAREIGGALETAHDANIVHCDIKPENILISHGLAVLADFGIARSMLPDSVGWRKTDYGSLGSPVYISPEQASGDCDLDQRSDIYSLACVIYEMLAGVPPFEGDSVEAIVAKRFTETPRLLHTFREDVPASLSRVIACALEPDPRDRFASVGRFVRALDTAASSAVSARSRRARGLLTALSEFISITPRSRAARLAH